ncbi:hypothetical protein Y032_0018g3676 [Ancylostoma ceylanicum]|uniref:Uncharacterized protein n=1 Tax=Ancylostoma ceylanicum TaxID=53326 RepID=A0A016V3Q0_9BILA|nr:hypothetical protein Y032_0018g3676 [Ancylostoma ceylanicum]
MVRRVGHGRSLKNALVHSRLSTRSHASHNACQPVEHIIANVFKEYTYTYVHMHTSLRIRIQSQEMDNHHRKDETLSSLLFPRPQPQKPKSKSSPSIYINPSSKLSRKGSYRSDPSSTAVIFSVVSLHFLPHIKRFSNVLQPVFLFCAFIRFR